jgi:hypothetical protein
MVVVMQVEGEVAQQQQVLVHRRSTHDTRARASGAACVADRNLDRLSAFAHDRTRVSTSDQHGKSQ